MIEIIWGILSAIGVACLGLIVWGIKRLIETTFNNTTQIELLNQNMERLLKDIDGVAAFVGTARSKGQRKLNKGDDDED